MLPQKNVEKKRSKMVQSGNFEGVTFKKKSNIRKSGKFGKHTQKSGNCQKNHISTNC